MLCASDRELDPGPAVVAAWDRQLWPHQERVLEQCQAALDAGHKAICVVSATGTGKSLIAFKQVDALAAANKRVAVYCNRRLLFEQLSRGLYESGITHGYRASGHRVTLSRNVQLCMAQTETRRVLEDRSRELHGADVVIVDEAHLQSTGTMKEIIRRHMDEGACTIGYTATPTGDVGGVYTHLVQGATVSEGRQCGALLSARCYGPDEPHMEWIRRVKAGEREFKGKMRTQYVHMIFGRVVDHWRRLNPEQRPTIVFAPGVAESRWICSSFWNLGVNAAHIDAKGVMADGESYSGDIMRQKVMDRFRAGEIPILCNRFVLREGIDVPEIYHGILATRFGEEHTYVQAVGRILRNHPSLPGHVILQDHGGNCLRFGSPNEDRFWELGQPDSVREYLYMRQRQEGIEPEPIICPECMAIRRSGDNCPWCGYVTPKRIRRVLQRDGKLIEYTTPFYRQKKIAPPNYKKIWLQCYWGAYKSGTRTFRQATAWFQKRIWDRYRRSVRPDPKWPFMPQRLIDEIQVVRHVPFERLSQGED